jgi:hypothetical protein
VAPGIKYKKNKDGVATKTFNWTVQDFNELTEEAITLWRLLAKLNGCIAGNNKLEEYFVFEADGSLR